MSLYNESICRVLNGSRFSVNIEARILKINKKRVKLEGADLGFPKMEREEMIANIEELYKAYKHSIPGERSERRRTNYFRALRLDDLSDDDLLFGLPREYARIKLELFILVCILNGSLTADFFGDGWFWQSETDPWLVIRKDMIEPTPRKGAAE